MDLLDLLGIGIGPFNLSLAALAEPTTLRTAFVDDKPAFSWHPGFLLPFGQLQVSPLKDCVTLVDPTSRHSFLNYLSKSSRLYAFTNRQSLSTTRVEFNDYYRWVTEHLRSLHFSEEVLDVTWSVEGFRVETSRGRYDARALAVGVGVKPRIPQCAVAHLGRTVYHVADFAYRPHFSDGERVLVVGGGQSGVEVVQHLLALSPPQHVTWALSRTNLFALDDNPFVNDGYAPAAVERFRAMPLDKRRATVGAEHLTSDGVTRESCTALYDTLYGLRTSNTLSQRLRMMPAVVLDDLAPDGRHWRATLRCRMTRRSAVQVVDRVVLATGYAKAEAQCVRSLFDLAARDADGIQLDDDYALRLPPDCPGPVFVQNRRVCEHGLQSANLSQVAYRNARMINRLLGWERYPARPDPGVFCDIGSLAAGCDLDREAACRP